LIVKDTRFGFVVVISALAACGSASSASADPAFQLSTKEIEGVNAVVRGEDPVSALVSCPKELEVMSRGKAVATGGTVMSHHCGVRYTFDFLLHGQAITLEVKHTLRSPYGTSLETPKVKCALRAPKSITDDWFERSPDSDVAREYVCS
jgi:hypothetical protein